MFVICYSHIEYLLFHIEYPSGRFSDRCLIFEYQIGYPTMRSSDGHLIFDYGISIWDVIRWAFDIQILKFNLMFDTRILKIHLEVYEMDV